MTRATETKIIRKTAKAMIDAGYTIRVHDGCEFATKNTVKMAEIMAHCFATDTTVFRVYGSDEKQAGWVQFIHGNGADVIHDYTCTLDAIMEPVSEYSENL